MKLSNEHFVKTYRRYYPEYTVASLRKAVAAILKKFNSISSTTLDYYMRPRVYGGKGYGQKKKGR